MFTILMFLFVSNSFAANAALNKLGRGITNIVTAPLEIPKEIRAHWIKGAEKTYHVIAWMVCGFVKGNFTMAARFGSGAWDVISFPVNIPENYEPLFKPEFVFDNWPEKQEGFPYKFWIW